MRISEMLKSASAPDVLASARARMAAQMQKSTATDAGGAAANLVVGSSASQAPKASDSFVFDSLMAAANKRSGVQSADAVATQDDPIVGMMERYSRQRMVMQFSIPGQGRMGAINFQIEVENAYRLVTPVTQSQLVDLQA